MQSKKTILIAGASSGIGLQLATNLINDGHSVIALSRNGGPLDGHENYRHIQYDFRSGDSLPEITQELDGLVYCPGSITLKPINTIRKDDILSDLEINVIGAFLFAQTYRSRLLKSASPSIVFFSSVAASTGFPFHASVGISKGAIEGLTVSLAAELSPTIRVNCIAPSLTDTPLAAHLLKSDEKRQANIQRHPLKKIGTAQDIAEAAAFLLLQANWMTGQVIAIDGGMGSLVK